MNESVDQYREQRIKNLEGLKEYGFTPFGHAFERSGNIAEIRGAFEENKEVKAAGRLAAIREMGKSIFADINDGTAKIQLYLGAKVLDETHFKALKLLDIGDHIGVEGTLFTTRTGEPTIRVVSWDLLSKAILQPPEKFHGLVDTEERYRKRYLDLVSNAEVRARFNARIAIVRETREYLHSLGFMEVETPMMQPHAGGAAAKPFITHYNALDCNMYMRIAPELYLKRLLVGGFDKIFELNRDFRNEGLDRTHNPEFTVLELYEAFGDRHSMRRIIEGLIPRLCERVIGSMKIGEIDFTPPYRELAYNDLIDEFLSSNPDSSALNEIRELFPNDELMFRHEVYDKLIERNLQQPTFVIGIPRQFIPLAKTCVDNPELADAFEFVVGGKELCPGYTEQNDPFEQRRAFADQAGEDTEKIDEDFIAALEHGMPPAGGMGIGIDRLVMLLTSTDAIRDVILFPQLKLI